MSQSPQDSEQQTISLFWGKSGVQQMKMMMRGFQTMRKRHDREARLHIFMPREVAKGGMPSAPLKLGDPQSWLVQCRGQVRQSMMKLTGLVEEMGSPTGQDRTGRRSVVGHSSILVLATLGCASQSTEGRWESPAREQDAKALG